MSAPAPISGEDGLRLGLLMETAQTHQQLADQSLARLEAHTQGLDSVVREEIRRTFVAECGALVEEAGKAAEALRHLNRVASRHFGWLSAAVAVVSAVGGLLLLQRLLPSVQQLAMLQIQRQQLTAAIRGLPDSGARLQLRRCGSAQRLCVRVDRRAPAYGEAGDYLVVKGY